MMYRIYFAVLFFFLITNQLFAQSGILIIKHDLESVKTDYPWTNQHSIQSGIAFSGTSFSRTDSINLYGIGWKGVLPLNFIQKNVEVSISGFSRFSGIGGKASLVVSVLKDDSMVYWENRSIKEVGVNVWNSFMENLKLPMNITGQDYTLHIYLWNENGKVICDLDDLTLEFSEIQLPSFMIKGDRSDNGIMSSSRIEVYSGNYFKMYYDKFDTRFNIVSPNERVLLNSFSLYSSWTESNKKSEEFKEQFNYSFIFRGDSLSELGKYFMFEARSEICNTKIQLLFSDTEPILTFSITSTFLRPVRLHRHSFSATNGPQLVEVYRNSSAMDTVSFQEEYWLGKGGFQVFSDSAGFIFYQPEKISSLQLKPSTNRMTVNLDWEMDHPLLHWPLLKESENQKENHSSTVVEKGSVISAEFNIQGIRQKRKVPRVMRFPAGRTGAIIWTEHADYSDLRLQRAVNFGSEDIVSGSNASGGFVKHRIPVTKSVFYSNPDSVLNSAKVGFLSSEVANVRSTPGFNEFLLDLQSHGQEICLHTPDHYTSKRPIITESLQAMKRDFKSVTWIDHGYDNAPKSNRENLVCDGLNKKSEHFSLDLWNEFGLRYFWNCFYEDTNLYSDYSFNSFLSLPYYGWGDRFPVPEYWTHSSRSGDIVHWRTTGTLDPPDGGMWNYFFDETRLSDLLKSRKTSVLHVYPSRADSSNGFYSLRNGKFQIEESFDKILERQSQLRDGGMLHLSSIREHLDFQLALDQLEIRFLTSGKVLVENKSETDLKGITFVIPEQTVGVRGKNIRMRNENTETFFWFDLNKGESIMIDQIR